MVKEADILFTVPMVLIFWLLDEHEPIIVALCIHVVNIRDWKGLYTIRHLRQRMG